MAPPTYCKTSAVRCVEYIFTIFVYQSKKKVEVAPLPFSVNYIEMALVVHLNRVLGVNLVAPSTGAT